MSSPVRSLSNGGNVVECGRMEAAAPPNVARRAARFVVRDILIDIIRFPIWWYTRGTANALRFVWSELLSIIDRLSLRILIRNLGKPMYGDYSRSGRIISFFIRLMVFGFKLVGLAIWIAVLFAGLSLWFFVLPAAVFQVVIQLAG